MLAAELLRDGGVVYVPAGGTHHGLPGPGERVLLHSTIRCSRCWCCAGAGLRRIAYVDIDAHHCDGVEHAFAGDPEALLISVHEEGRWPFTGRAGGAGGGELLQPARPARLQRHRDAGGAGGADPAAPGGVPARGGGAAMRGRCAGGGPAVAAVACRTTRIGRWWRRCARFAALLVLGGGGYDPWSVGRCWAGVWATLAGQDIPDRCRRRREAVLAAAAAARGPREPAPAHDDHAARYAARGRGARRGARPASAAAGAAMIRAFVATRMPEDAARSALAVQQFLLPLPRRVSGREPAPDAGLSGRGAGRANSRSCTTRFGDPRLAPVELTLRGAGPVRAGAAAHRSRLRWRAEPR